MDQLIETGSETKMTKILPIALATFLSVAGGPAEAHVGEAAAGGFFSGFSHPISGLDHVLAMVAVGIWGAQLGAPALWLLPVMFPLVMAFGGFLGLVGVPLPGVEMAIALSALVLGTAVVLQARPPLAAALFIVCAFAIFHGHAHGTELPPGESGLLYSVGFVVGTGCLHLVGIGLGVACRWDWGRRALQGAGAAVALGGVLFLWRAMA
jgi:urease accessory protein